MKSAEPSVPGEPSRSRGSATRRPAARTLLLLIVAVVALGGCRSSGGARPVPTAELTVPSEVEEQLWSLRREELWTQRLFRMHYDGPEGDGSFKLTLRLASADLFQMTAVDRLSRRWFSLAVSGDDALLLDHRAKTYCRYAEEIELVAVPLGPLPFSTLPALLLGRLPLEAASPVEIDGAELSFFDRRGRRWTAALEQSRLRNWILWGEDGPEVWWQAGEDSALLSARSRRLQLRWRQVVSEPMTPPLAEMSVPSGYTRGECDGAGAERAAETAAPSPSSDRRSARGVSNRFLRRTFRREGKTPARSPHRDRV